MSKSTSKDIEPDAENFYKCHVGAVTAAANCKLKGIESEAKCQFVNDEACVGFLAKGKALNKKEEFRKPCAEEVKEDYSGCIVKNYKQISASKTPIKDDRPFKGVNCLHDFIDMPGCALDGEKKKHRVKQETETV